MPNMKIVCRNFSSTETVNKFKNWFCIIAYEELDVPAVSALRRAIAEVKQRWSVIGWVTKNLLSGPHALEGTLTLVSAAFALVSTYQPALGPCGGLLPVLLMCNHKESLCPGSGDVNKLLMNIA
jgi:hypothetical protein